MKFFTSNFKSVFFSIFVSIFFLISCTENPTVKNEKKYLEPSTIEQLGELLFFDSILSQKQNVSCASCHKPDFAFADNVPFSFGDDSLPGSRNTPSAMNLLDHRFFFHDGRAESLEQQASGPIENPVEMNLLIYDAVKRLNEHKYYSKFFKKIFGGYATKDNLVKAIAAYENTLETSDTDWDNYRLKDDTSYISASARRGHKIFVGKGKCFDCHFGPDFTNDDFKNIGLFNGKDWNDSGRFLISRDIKELGSFKVPGLRNIEVTAPYMHNGKFKTLDEVIEYYDNPDKIVANSVNRDTSMLKPLNLTAQEKSDLKSFLLSLTDNRFKKKK